MAPPFPWWWVVDLAGGTTIDGSRRVAVEVVQDELGCGEEHHPIDSFQVAKGDTVTFELVDGDPGAKPDLWMPPGSDTYADVPAVRARQFFVSTVPPIPPMPLSVCFGGPDRTDLCVVTGSSGAQIGCVFVLPVDVPGTVVDRARI
jgi:hypothetical protein